MDIKLLGGILLIVGTSIGAGMLGLPVAAAQVGFLGATILLFLVWAFMLMGAFLILEVNLLLPVNTNMVSMAKKTIGLPGQVLAWLVYLLLLYSLLCAYIAGGSGLLSQILSFTGINLSTGTASILFTILFGLVVYAGIQAVDKTNRVLITLKFVTLFAVTYLLIPSISIETLVQGRLSQLTSITAITVTITSFGWAILVPSLRSYFSDDIKMLKKAIVIGSLIPLVCYIAWDAVIMGIIPLKGYNSLDSILNASNATSSLVNVLSAAADSSITVVFIHLFISISVLTSFLGVALCLTDFLADGLDLKKQGKKNIALHLLTFIPAVGISIFVPGLFIKALKYAGIYCIVLLVLLPAWMAWCGRNRSDLKRKYTFPGGKMLLAFIIFLSLALLIYISIDAFFL
jgi:tyrosine-specific transport protein